MADLYKSVLEQVVERLWADPNILAVAVFGSSEDGSAVIEDSDLDLYVIERGEEKVWKSVYLRESGVLVHLQYLSKAQLAECAAMVRGGPFHKAFSSSRLIRARDDEVESVFQQRGHFAVSDQRLRLMEAAGNLCFEMHLLRKIADGPRTRSGGRAGEPAGSPARAEAEPWIPQAYAVLEGLARVVVLTAGGIPGRSCLAQVVKVDPALKEALGLLERTHPSAPAKILDLAEERVENGIEDWSKPLLSHLRECGCPLSVDEIENVSAFRDLKTNFERLALRLAQRGVLGETRRPFTPTLSSKPVAEEVVYSA